jgi:hypothetical protein
MPRFGCNFLASPADSLNGMLTRRHRSFFSIAGTALVYSSIFCAITVQAQINVLSGKKAISLRVRIEDSDCQPLIAENKTNATITVERVEAGAWSEFFELNDTSNIPRKLAPGESANLGYICFRPTIAGKEYHASLHIITSPLQPAENEISFHGVSYAEAKVNIAPATGAGAVLAFDPQSNKDGALISMIGHDLNFMRSYTFKNTSSAPYTVTDVHFQNNDRVFDVAGIEPDGELPFDVNPGASFSVRFSYSTQDRIPHENILVISTGESKDAVKYEVRGLALPLSEMQWNKAKPEAH